MIYKQFKDKKLSALGFGTMRLPLIDGDDSKVDEAKAAEMFDYAIKNGVNYFDTAYGYHSGNSEIVTGKILSKYPRDSFYLATKFPGYDLRNMDKVETIFPEQLQKTGVDYFDFYLVHNVCERNIEQYLDPKYGIYDYLMEQKKKGLIHHLGFSVHGSYETMERFLEKYGEGMEFCQIQLNYIDWDFQDAKEKIELLKEYKIPVWVMEPVRGGKLASLDEKYASQLKALRPDESIVSWAFRFIQSIPEVVVTLSGMTEFEQVKENIEIFSEDKSLDGKELSALLDIAEDMTSKKSLPCTACRYCTSHCPMELDIPTLLELYNEHTFSGGGFIAPMRVNSMDESKRPSACIGCQSCEAVCPQGIEISKAMSDFSEKLGLK
ncbi:MAG: aldo/keto reductase [Clostridia bacterium]|nr:aldo/keto reductase [Clostridia bacterium]